MNGLDASASRNQTQWLQSNKGSKLPIFSESKAGDTTQRSGFLITLPLGQLDEENHNYTERKSNGKKEDIDIFNDSHYRDASNRDGTRTKRLR